MNRKHPYLFIFSTTLFILLFISLVSTNIFMLAIKDTSTSYSITRKWPEYYNLENWNMPGAVRQNLDGDGTEDIITFNGCALISSANISQLSESDQCHQPASFPEPYVGQKNERKIGQQLGNNNDKFSPLKQSFLVKTNNGIYRYYEIKAFSVSVFELKKDGLFQEINPSFLDYVDTLFFLLSHRLVVVLTLLLL